MPELDDARTLVAISALELEANDIHIVYDASTNTLKKLPHSEFLELVDGGGDPVVGSGVLVYSSGTPTMTATTGTGNVLRGDQAVSTTSNPTFPSVNGATTFELRTAGVARLTLNSTTATFSTALVTTGGNTTIGVGWSYLVNGRGGFTMSVNGSMVIYDNSGTTFNLLQLGGTTASYPAIKRNATALEFKLANDSAFCGIAAATLNLDKTITAAGTTGARTINQATGSVNFAAAASSLVVTNSLVTANSIIIATVGTNDLNMSACRAVAAAGSFTLYPDAPPAAETRVNFLVTN